VFIVCKWLCKVKIIFLYCNNPQIDLTTALHVLIYIFSFCKENNHQTLLSVLSFILHSSFDIFSQMKNEDDGLVSKTCKIEDTKYRRQLKLDVCHILLQYPIESALQQTCFVLWIWLLKEFLYFQIL
jgi:hypothetical protein